MQLGLRRVMTWGHWRGARLVFWLVVAAVNIQLMIGARPPVGMFGEKGISMEFIYIIYIYCIY